MKIEDLKIGDSLRVTKDIYYVSEDMVSDGEYYTKEELFDGVSHMLVVGDVWEFMELDEYNEPSLKCVESEEWKDEWNEGWWSLENMLEKDCFELVK
jgi:hypothetical protein